MTNFLWAIGSLKTREILFKLRLNSNQAWCTLDILAQLSSQKFSQARPHARFIYNLTSSAW
jgi:hypothetical protein